MEGQRFRVQHKPVSTRIATPVGVKPVAEYAVPLCTKMDPQLVRAACHRC